MAQRAVIYLRSSKDRHDVSVESQRRELQRYIEQAGDILIDEFVDKVESAKTANRPAFQDMMGEVKTKKCRFSIIYCYDTSRFSRRKYDAQMYKHLLKKNGIGLTFLKLPKGDPLMDSVLESLMEIFDEFHSQKSKMDGLRGMRENVAKGWRAGGSAPIGYKLEKIVVGTRDGEPITKSTLAPDPKIFDKIKMYFQGRIAGVNRNHLVDKLALNIPKTSLTYLEENALTYAGHTVWNRHNEFIDGQYTGGKRYRERSQWVIQRDTHEAMITESEAEQLLTEREQARTGRKRRKVSHYLLAGLLHCKCGANYNGNSGYYRCQKDCGNRGIKKETIEGIVVDALFEQILNESTVKNLLNRIQAEAKKQPQADNKSAKLKQELKHIEKQIQDLVQLITQVKHQRPILEKIDLLEEERGTLEKLLSESDPATKKTWQNISESGVRKFSTSYKRSFDQGDFEQKKALIKSCVGSIELNGNEAKIKPSYVSITGLNWRPQGDSNPCCRRERAVS